MAARPRFNTLWPGEWPHHPTLGVGVLFSGRPNDRERFIACVAEYSCGADPANRLVKRLIDFGSASLTLSFGLDYDQIAEALRGFGVSTTIIAPRPDLLRAAA